MDGRDDILSMPLRRRLENEQRLKRVDAELNGVPIRRRLLFSPISQYVFISPLPCNAPDRAKYTSSLRQRTTKFTKMSSSCRAVIFLVMKLNKDE